jgi:hypothetical protein
MIVSRKNLYLTGALLFCVSGAIQADVPYVFQQGDTIRSDEINENFRHLDSEVGTLSDDVESGANSAGPADEDYTYNQKNLTVGRDKLTVLSRPYDIVAIDTLSFKDHDLFNVKFPVTRSYPSNPTGKALDLVSMYLPSTLERRYDDKISYSDRISGYPASVYVYVSQSHLRPNLNGREVTEAEYDDLEWEKHYFDWSADEEGVYNQLRLDIYAIHPNPYRASDYSEYYRIDCGSIAQAQGDFPGEFSWNADTNEAYKLGSYGDETSILSEIPDVKSGLSTAIDTCIADSKADRQYKWRKGIYNTYMMINIVVQILLDDATVFNLSFDFDSYTYEADFRKSCQQGNIDTEDGWNCGAEVAALQRDFSSLIDQQNTLARKSRREEFVKELFTLLDHIVISEAAEN